MAPPEVISILQNSCFDCHSNDTRWPWYTRVPPFSKWIGWDVQRGRQELNFSEWGGYYPATKHRKLQWIDRSMRQGDMPPLSYRLMHPGSGLSEADRRAVEDWVQQQLAHR